MVKKNPGVAAVLSFFVPGLGQIYNGEFGKGFGFIAGIIISGILCAIYIGFILLLILWVWAIIDAHRVAETENNPEAIQ